MIIVIAGEPGAGTTTVSQIIAKKLRFKLIRIGELTKEIAKQHNKTILQLMEENQKNVKKLVEFNKKLDEMQKKIAKEEKNVIFNSKLGAFNNPQADLKILLIADLKERAERVAKREKTTTSQAMTQIKEREELERKQWRKIYCFDYVMDKDNYDKVIDTTKHTAEEVAEIIMNTLKVKKEEE